MARIRTLYLIRHAVAEKADPSSGSDAARPLSPDGIERWKRQVRGLGELEVAIDHILTSPYVRTRQTAELLADGFRPEPAVTECSGLRPGGSAEEVVRDLRAVFHAGATSIALVGHAPSVGRLAAHFTGATQPMPFKKGAVCRIDFESTAAPGAGWLTWFLPPRALRALGA